MKLNAIDSTLPNKFRCILAKIPNLKKDYWRTVVQDSFFSTEEPSDSNDTLENFYMNILAATPRQKCPDQTEIRSTEQKFPSKLPVTRDNDVLGWAQGEAYRLCSPGYPVHWGVDERNRSEKDGVRVNEAVTSSIVIDRFVMKPSVFRGIQYTKKTNCKKLEKIIKNRILPGLGSDL